MSAYLKIYGMIAIAGIISALLDKFIWKRKETVLWSAIYSAVYYYFIVLARTIAGNGTDYLSFSFGDKTASGYLKVAILLATLFIMHQILMKVLGDRYATLLRRTVGFFATVLAVIIVIVKIPTMLEVTIAGAVSILGGLLALALKKRAGDGQCGAVILLKDRYLVVASLMSLFAMLYLIAGPAELYAYNSGDFIYSYGVVAGPLLAGSIIIVVFFSIILANLLSDRVFSLVTLILFVFLVGGYIQSMFLNGQMNEIDGSVQGWSSGAIVINTIIWAVLCLTAIIASVKARTATFIKAIKTVSIVIVLIQLVTFVFLFITTDIATAKTRQVLKDGEFELSVNDNIVMFILDAYDVQMLEKVVESDSEYLDPLHDFVYYSDMTSIATATDGSLPYILTGINNNDVDENGDRLNWYEDTHFLSDIKANDYDIRILTERKYVDELKGDVIANYSDEGVCQVDGDKAIAAFSKAMRYKCMPLLFKANYRYESYEFTNIITDSNIYIYGTDYQFEEELLENGLTTDLQQNALRIYHLYGAHAPYFLTEDAKLDYDSNPLAQWKGALKITYDYIDALKEAGLYDDATIIITADHGLNHSQMSALDALGITYDANSTNPICFVKLPGQRQDDLMVIDEATEHGLLFDTIMRMVDSDWTDAYKGVLPGLFN